LTRQRGRFENEFVDIFPAGPGTPEQLADFLKAERARWSKLVKDINLQPE